MPEANKEPVQPELDLEAIVDETNSQKGAIITLDPAGKEVRTESVGPEGNTSDGGAQRSPEETIEGLRKEIEAAKTREAEKQERISRLEAENQTQVKKATTAIDNEFRAKEISVESAISASKNELDSIKRQLKSARETGDIDKEIELEEKLADVRYQYNATMWQKDNLAQLKKAQEDRAKTAASTGPRQFSPREQKWIDEHPKYNSDEDYQTAVWSLDAQAKRKGIIPDTDAYYEYLNTRIDKMYGEKAPEGGQTVTVPVAKTNNSASTAAPVGRGGSSSNAGSNTQIRLTPEQLEAADFMGMSPVEYAQDLINQQKEKGR